MLLVQQVLRHERHNILRLATRRTFSTRPLVGTPVTQPSRRPLYYGAAAALTAGCAIAQTQYGQERDFYDYRFVTNKDVDDLASFYGGEEFMELFCVMPFVGTLMMRGGQFDDEGTVNTTGFPGDLQVSMVFSDEDDDDGTTKWFNKRERFRDVLFGYTCWDMVANFGFEKLPDGRVMVYHHGEYFKSRFPPFSLLVRLVFGVHARWVAWATEHHLNHYAFENDTEADEELEEESRTDMPLFLLKNYAWTDLLAGVFGQTVDKPSFLANKSSEAAIPEEERDVIASLPVKRAAIQRRMTLDIRLDRHNTKLALEDGEEHPIDDNEATTKSKKVNLTVGLQRTSTLTRRLTKITAQEEPQDYEYDLGREDLGGNPAWEALRATNDPKAYKAVTLAARERQTQRRLTRKLTKREEQQENGD